MVFTLGMYEVPELEAQNKLQSSQKGISGNSLSP